MILIQDDPCFWKIWQPTKKIEKTFSSYYQYLVNVEFSYKLTDNFQANFLNDNTYICVASIPRAFVLKIHFPFLQYDRFVRSNNRILKFYHGINGTRSGRRARTTAKS